MLNENISLWYINMATFWVQWHICPAMEIFVKFHVQKTVIKCSWIKKKRMSKINLVLQYSQPRCYSGIFVHVYKHVVYVFCRNTGKKFPAYFWRERTASGLTLTDLTVTQMLRASWTDLDSSGKMKLGEITLTKVMLRLTIWTLKKK